jgi:hypothetical protein
VSAAPVGHGRSRLAEGAAAFVASICLTVLVVWFSDALPDRDDVSDPYAISTWVLAIWLFAWLVLARRWALLVGLLLGFVAQFLVLVWLLSQVEFT